MQTRPRPTQVAAAREGERQGAAGVAVAELAQVVGRALEHRVVLELVVAQRRGQRRGEQGGARWALAAACLRGCCRTAVAGLGSLCECARVRKAD